MGITTSLLLVAIGAILIWAVVAFARTSWTARDRVLVGVGAAGIGLSAESLIYPTLEVQLLSLTWWLLLVLCLRAPVRPLLDRIKLGRGPAQETEEITPPQGHPTGVPRP